MAIPANVAQRVARGLLKAPKRAVKNYRVPNARGGMQTLCTSCGALLNEDYVDDEGGHVNRVTSNYAEITIVFDDGSRHEHCVCRRCQTTLTKADAEWIYAIVLKRFRELENEGHGPVAWRAIGLRKPVALLPYSRVKFA